MKRGAVPVLAAWGCVLLVSGCGPDHGKDLLAWKSLPSLPDPVGFAGAFAGVSNGELIVAGGANFPTGRPWDGAQKVWHDRIFILAGPRDSWRSCAQKLPRPLAYGVSASASNAVVCCGGGDAERHYADAFLLRWDGTKVAVEPLPPMPGPAAFFCGAVVGESLYVAGGRAAPDSPETLRTLWAIDLAEVPTRRKWRELPPWPGPGRMLAVAAAQDGHFFLISGVDLVRGRDGKPRRRYLRDVYRYTPGFGWRRMADLPRPVAGAPTPAEPWRDTGLLVFGGDDSLYARRVSMLKDHHPGFTPQILRYDVVENRWHKAGRMLKRLGPNPAGHPNLGIWPTVTTPTTRWRGRVVVPSGEARPGVRTPRVLWGGRL